MPRRSGVFQEGLRLAGERDHADEEADFGVPADDALHDDFAGLTPTTASGATTIRTADLARFLQDPTGGHRHGFVFMGPSIPGAVGLKFRFGGSLTDGEQDRLRSKLRELTAGDLDRPIVAVGFNSERFDGRNLALRLAALGYLNVYWYRGGREAWEGQWAFRAELTIPDW